MANPIVDVIEPCLECAPQMVKLQGELEYARMLNAEYEKQRQWGRVRSTGYSVRVHRREAKRIGFDLPDGITWVDVWVEADPKW